MTPAPLGTLESTPPEWWADRQLRKQLVFPIMYGWYRDATESEMTAWRALAADFINGRRADVPLTLEDFRELSHD